MEKVTEHMWHLLWSHGMSYENKLGIGRGKDQSMEQFLQNENKWIAGENVSIGRIPLKILVDS